MRTFRQCLKVRIYLTAQEWHKNGDGKVPHGIKSKRGQRFFPGTVFLLPSHHEPGVAQKTNRSRENFCRICTTLREIPCETTVTPPLTHPTAGVLLLSLSSQRIVFTKVGKRHHTYASYSWSAIKSCK
jgi:hypothetical protein